MLLIYLQLANKLVHSMHPRAITMAEEVSGMPGLCRPIKEGGIGFDFRLGMAIPDYWIRLLKEKKDEDWDLREMWHVLNNRRPDVKTIAYCESHDQALVGDQTLAFRLMQSEIYFHMNRDDKNIDIDRGIALHKMIRLITITLGGQAYLNFMGNEFGHPDWIDFPREGNNWSYHYARRQWSLLEDPRLKYKCLAAFDRKMLKIMSDYAVMEAGFGRELNTDEVNKTLIFERNKLIFVFNFHTDKSIPDYEFIVPEPGDYRILLNSDSHEFGGHERIDEDSVFISRYNEINNIHTISIYNTNRTALVLKKKISR